ncbi:MAG: hypothetical protein WC476_00605 [Phycisphaerae bacterium]
MSILSAIGNTPLVELNKLNNKKPKVRIFGKYEGANPDGSIRKAHQLLDAEPDRYNMPNQFANENNILAQGTMVVILPDRGDRRLSTPLFRSICAKCPP